MVLVLEPAMMKRPNWLKPESWFTAPWYRLSYGVVGRKLTVPKAASALFSTVGDSWFARRGRSSRAHCARASSRRFGRRVLVNWPTTMLVLSFSVPLFDSALVVLGSSALPRLLELRAR